MKIPSAATLAMYRWIDDGIKKFDTSSQVMRQTLQELVDANDDVLAAAAMRSAANISIAHDIALGGKCGLVVPLLQATVDDGIDWQYIISQFRCQAELN